MSKELINALISLINGTSFIANTDESVEQRRVIVLDLLWKLARKDYHGVADCAMDLRELHL